MAIVFSQKQKKQQLLILVFILVMAATALVVYLGIYKKPKSSSGEIFVNVRNVNIDFNVLNNPIFSKLDLFGKLLDFEGASGRLNPFKANQ